MFFTTFVSFFDSYSLGTTDSDIDNHLFLDSPVNVITVLLAYVLFIFKWGPQIMKSREPFNLKTLMIIYNVVQVFFNLILFIMAARLMPNFSAYCSPANISHTATDVAIRKVHYYYVLLKFIDFFDTVFFILRKKHSQISLLHLHHHIGIASTTWVTLKTIPGGVAMFVFLVNTFVHVIMYLYYLINLLDRTKTMWWKKHLTQLQLVQHFFVFIVFFIHLINYECSYSKGFLIFYLMNTLTTIYLFSKFYFKNYIFKKTHSKAI